MIGSSSGLSKRLDKSLLTRHTLQVYVSVSHYEFVALVVVHVQKDPSFAVQVDYQSLHYVIVLEFLEFGPELFLVFIHLRVHFVHFPLFEHQ